MKHKTADIEGALLDSAVAMAQGWQRVRVYDNTGKPWDHDAWCEDGDPQRSMHNAEGRYRFSPSTNWPDGGEIIERERIDVLSTPEHWAAKCGAGASMSGPTPLIAAMRAYVASKFGDEVDL